MAKTWIKMYTECIHDRKIWKLKPIEQLTFWYLCCLAGIEDDDGRLPSTEDIEMELQMPLGLKRCELDRTINGLVSSGLLFFDETGVLVITNFEKRQMSNLSEAEKKAKYRDKIKTRVGQNVDTCPQNVHYEKVDNVRTDVQKMSTVEEEVEEEVEVEKEEDINNCADAQIQKRTSTPDDPDFWKFAKGNEKLAEAFYKATGISPVKSQFGRWVNDLRDLAEAGISPEQLRKTVNYMYSENIPVSAPGSCLKTAQYLKSRGSVPSKSSRQQQQKPPYNAFEELAMQMNGVTMPECDVEL